MTEFEKRCEDCACLIQKDKVWCCDECFGQNVNDIDDCPEGVKLEDVQKAQDVKTPKLVGKSEKERKPSTRERKPNDDKRFLIAELNEALEGVVDDINVTNVERELVFHFKGTKYKLVLSAPRS